MVLIDDVLAAAVATREARADLARLVAAKQTLDAKEADAANNIAVANAKYLAALSTFKTLAGQLP